MSISPPLRKLRETDLFSMAPSWAKTTEATRLPMGLVSYFISSNELYISMSLTCEESIAMTLTTLASLARIRLSSFWSIGSWAATSAVRQSWSMG